MKIAFYIPKNIPQSGGAFTFETSVIEALKKIKSRHEIVVFDDDRLREEFKSTFFKKVSNRLKIKKSKTSNLNKAVRKYNIELIWFLTPSYQIVDIPFVYTVWDLQHRLQPYFPEVSVTGSTFDNRENYYKSAIQRALYIITGNESGREEIKRFYGIPDFRIKMIEFPVPKFTGLSPIKLHDIDKQYLFYPAQFWPHKNHILILLATKILEKKYGLNFDVVFTGSDKGNMNYIKEKTMELGLNGKVHFLGFVPTESLISLYKKAFALVFPSFFGPNNIPPLEAFSLGCPVISSDVSGMKLQLKDAALFFNPLDEYYLAYQIKRLFDDVDLRLALIKRGFDISKTRTPEDYVKKVMNIIDEFVNIRRCWSNKERYIHP